VLVLTPHAGAEVPTALAAAVRPLVADGLVAWETPRIERANVDLIPQLLADRWRGGQELVVLEADKRPSSGQLRALLACPRPPCAWAYRIYPSGTGLPQAVIAHRRIHGAADVRWITGGDVADLAGLGLVRIDVESQRAVPPVWGRGWLGFDTRLSQALAAMGRTWHVHWPEIFHAHPLD
jgi:hypothetical protein